MTTCVPIHGASRAPLSPEAAAKLRRIIRTDGVELTKLESKMSRDSLACAAAEFNLHRSTRVVLELWLSTVPT